MPDGIAPFFRSAGWNMLWQTGDLRVLPSLGARWLLTYGDQGRELLQRQGRDDLLKEVSRKGKATVWRYLGPLGPGDGVAEASLAGVKRGPESMLQGETVQPMDLYFDQAVSDCDVGVRWIAQPGTDPGGAIEPLVLRGATSPEGERHRFSHALVPPLVEGDYLLEITVNGQPVKLADTFDREALKVRFDWTSQARRARVLAFAGDLVTFSPGDSALAPPLAIGMRLFRHDENRYSQPFGFEARGLWQGPSEVRLHSLSEDFSFPIPEGQRADFFLLDRSGREVLLTSGSLSRP
jgi:hypothetical protein